MFICMVFTCRTASPQSSSWWGSEDSRTPNQDRDQGQVYLGLGAAGWHEHPGPLVHNIIKLHVHVHMYFQLVNKFVLSQPLRIPCRSTKLYNHEYTLLLLYHVPSMCMIELHVHVHAAGIRNGNETIHTN